VAEEIGLHKLVSVVTDNASNMRGNLLFIKLPRSMENNRGKVSKCIRQRMCGTRSQSINWRYLQI
jgi:hypothetical protein